MINAALVYHLGKALYGLKQALYILYALILEFSQGLKFIKTDTDYSIFVFHDKSTFISVYIDNFLIIGKDLNIINGLKNKLLESFCITDLRLISHYLGMAVICTADFAKLDHRSYLKKVHTCFGINASSLKDLRVLNSMLTVSENQ